MKAIRVLILVFLLCLSAGVSARAAEAGELQDAPWNINVSAGYPGFFSYSGVGEGVGTAIGQVFAVIFTFGLYKPHSEYERVEDSITPAFAIQAGRQVLPWLEVNGDVFYHYAQKKCFVHEADVEPQKIRVGHSVSLLPGCKFTYLNKGVFHMYSSVNIGAGFNHVTVTSLKTVTTTDEVSGEEHTTTETVVDKTPRVRFAFQTTPVGMAVGNRFYGFFDLGVGTEYTGVRAGLGLRF